MAENIASIRQSLRQAPSQVKQGNIAAAVQSIQNGIKIMRGGTLLKAERKELEDLIDASVMNLNLEPTVKQLFPLAIAYTPGGEAALADSMNELQSCLAEQAQNSAEEAKRLTQEKKMQRLEKGKAELTTNVEKGRATLLTLGRDYPQDAVLLGDIGEVFLKAKLYDEAVTFLSEALDLRDDILPLYNLIGMALRELGRFPLAETYYLRASKYLRNDPNLYFNISRLYLEWKKLDKARQAVSVALKLDPDFVHAQKMLAHVDRKIAEEAAG